MSLFYTGKGDKGKSDLGRKKVSKRRPEIAALYNLDELNSLLGLVRHQKMLEDFVGILERAQENLFIVQANVGALLAGGEHAPPVFSEEKVKETEKLIDGFEKEVQPERGFVIPGADEVSAWL